MWAYFFIMVIYLVSRAPGHCGTLSFWHTVILAPCFYGISLFIMAQDIKAHNEDKRSGQITYDVFFSFMHIYIGLHYLINLRIHSLSTNMTKARRNSSGPSMEVRRSHIISTNLTKAQRKRSRIIFSPRGSACPEVERSRSLGGKMSRPIVQWGSHELAKLIRCVL